jgi:hypothetical protein
VCIKADSDVAKIDGVSFSGPRGWGGMRPTDMWILMVLLANSGGIDGGGRRWAAGEFCSILVALERFKVFSN